MEADDSADEDRGSGVLPALAELFQAMWATGSKAAVLNPYRLVFLARTGSG